VKRNRGRNRLDPDGPSEGRRTLSLSQRLRLLAARPFRTYLRLVRFPRGKGFIIRYFLKTLLPSAPASFYLPIPGGNVAKLGYREGIGQVAWVYGSFEAAELRYVLGNVQVGATVIDVGANVGVVSLALAAAVGPTGTVVAVEPDHENAKRLAENISLNNLRNVDIHEVALGETAGETTLYLADDPAYHSLLPPGEPAHGSRRVPMKTIDDLWHEYLRPQVSFLKIDVEGSEAAVLEGGLALLEACQPQILVEADGAEAIATISRLLLDDGYRHMWVRGLQPWNHLFVPRLGHSGP
jgi:FkbM family methyltransferase